MAKREHFFEFSWPVLIGVIFAIAGAWFTQGPDFVLTTSAVAVVSIGVYYVVWRWLRERNA